MGRSRSRWTILLTLLATLAVAGGVGVAAEISLEELSRPHLAPSADVGLLAPITDAGRTGWDCAPEKAARATTARAAELPASDR
jgi:hypothetical protein